MTIFFVATTGVVTTAMNKLIKHSCCHSDEQSEEESQTVYYTQLLLEILHFVQYDKRVSSREIYNSFAGCCAG